MKQKSNVKQNERKDVPFLTFLFPFLFSSLLILFIEFLNRKSVGDTLSFVIRTPLFYLLNIVIVAVTLAPALLFRRRVFFYSTVGGLWMIVGITNAVLRSLRTTPFEPTDLSIFLTGVDIIGYYLKPWMIILIVVAIVFFIGLLGALFVKPKKSRRRLKGGFITILTTALLLASLLIPMKKTQTIPDKFGNLVDAYYDYGFVFCFTNGIFDRGIDKPDDYSEEVMTEYASRASLLSPEQIPDTKPNLIFVQLESFFNVNRLSDVVYSENPIPIFTSLLDAYPSGLLSVSSIGAGTANTEFEVISGMDLSSFGAGEYPCKSILLKETCESIPFLLSTCGYSTHAIHDNTATFYSRNEYFPNLGFETFTSIESMTGLTYNPLGWARDTVLTGEIRKTLEATPNSDYIYTISVQGHGGYPAKQIDPTQTIYVESGINDAEDLFAFEYYINQLHDMDSFVGELIADLSSFSEPTVVIFYGDHLPGISFIDEEQLSSGTLFDTEYVIWSNYNLDGEDRDLEAFQLAAHVLSLADFSLGNMVRLHQNCSKDEQYQEMIDAFEYDLLYGKRYLYENNVSPYVAPEMTFGIYQPTVTGTDYDGEYLTVYGSGFTEWCSVKIHGDKKDTVFVSDTELKIEFNAPDSPVTLSVCLYADVGSPLLAESEEYTVLLTSSDDE